MRIKLVKNNLNGYSGSGQDIGSFYYLRVCGNKIDQNHIYLDCVRYNDLEVWFEPLSEKDRSGLTEKDCFNILTKKFGFKKILDKIKEQAYIEGLDKGRNEIKNKFKELFFD